MKYPDETKVNCPRCNGTGKIIESDKAGAVFKKWRKSRGISQEQLAEITGIDQSQLSRFENGQQNFGQDRMRKLAEVLEK